MGNAVSMRRLKFVASNLPMRAKRLDCHRCAADWGRAIGVHFTRACSASLSPAFYHGFEMLSTDPVRVTRDAEFRLLRRRNEDLLMTIEKGR